MNVLNKEPRFHTVLMDADETLLDFTRSQEEALKNTLHKNGYRWSREINEIYSAENLRLWKKLERGETTRERLKVERFENFFRTIGIEGADIQKINEDYVECLSRCGFVTHGALALCKSLHGRCGLYIATNGLRKAQEGRLERSGLKPYIDGMFISDTVGFQKPAKEYFEYIFKTLQIEDKGDVIMLGDSLTSDMQGGKNAGITTCLFDPKEKTAMPHPLCDYKIKRLSDFETLLFD